MLQSCCKKIQGDVLEARKLLRAKISTCTVLRSVYSNRLGESGGCFSTPIEHVSSCTYGLMGCRRLALAYWVIQNDQNADYPVCKPQQKAVCAITPLLSAAHSSFLINDHEQSNSEIKGQAEFWAKRSQEKMFASNSAP